MRKLTVKNFSVIKEAELEFGKITVLIGPQASGKSLLCKLAYFLDYEVSRLAVDAILAGQEWLQFSSTLGKKFSEWFPPEGWGLNQSFIRFASGQYAIEVTTYRVDAAAGRVNTKLCSELADLYAKLAESQSELNGGVSPARRDPEPIWRNLRFLQDKTFVLLSAYIPAGRAFFTNANLGYASLSGPGIDPIVRNFALQIEWNSARSLVGLVTSGTNVTEQITMDMNQLVGGQVMSFPGGAPLFKSLDDRYLPLHLLSSGTQELLPLVNVLRRMAYEQEHVEVSAFATYDPPRKEAAIRTRSLVYLEEPEAHVFPKTQYELVKIFAWLTNDPLLDFSWIITTHSPYILSSFNNLLEAWQVAATKPDARDEVLKLIEQRYWVRPSDFKAYCIHDGNLEPIMDEETGLINGNYLDGVSDEIGSQFDELLRIGYVDA